MSVNIPQDDNDKNRNVKKPLKAGIGELILPLLGPIITSQIGPLLSSAAAYAFAVAEPTIPTITIDLRQSTTYDDFLHNIRARYPHTEGCLQNQDVLYRENMITASGHGPHVDYSSKGLNLKRWDVNNYNPSIQGGPKSTVWEGKKVALVLHASIKHSFDPKNPVAIDKMIRSLEKMVDRYRELTGTNPRIKKADDGKPSQFDHLIKYETSAHDTSHAFHEVLGAGISMFVFFYFFLFLFFLNYRIFN